MRNRCCVLLILFFMALMLNVSFANNIAVSNVSFINKDTANKAYDIKFDVSWDNSWFIAGAPSSTANWDAAWVFAKYSTYSSGAWSDWGHCTLLNTGYTAPSGAQMDFGITGSAYKGAFIYRSSAGSGSVNFANTKMKWNYGADGISDTATVKVKVFAIEMVYIPTGNFYIGDGTNRTGVSSAHFFDAADSADPRDPVLITSTQPYISNVNDGTGTAGDITWVNESTAGNLPTSRTQLGASYPTGYNAFYIMKYEISQGQYRDFLNSLTRTQQDNRTASQTANQYVMTNSASLTQRSGIRAPASIPSGTITFGCDFDADGTFNESTDGEWIACNWFSWMDGTAYADWAALRPFTELEFEKACRGPSTPVAGEYAWGSTSITPATGISNSGQTNEVPSDAAANCVYGNQALVQGPLRCGSLTDADDTRTEAGAGYYGPMELSGHMNERQISVMGSQTGTTLSTFDGSHGDGSVSSTGFATNSNWPGTDAQGSGFRGGYLSGVAAFVRVSDRTDAAAAVPGRSRSRGGRCARTAP